MTSYKRPFSLDSNLHFKCKIKKMTFYQNILKKTQLDLRNDSSVEQRRDSRVECSQESIFSNKRCFKHINNNPDNRSNNIPISIQIFWWLIFVPIPCTALSLVFDLM